MKTEMEKKIEALMKEWADYCHRKWPGAIFVKDGAFPFYNYDKHAPKVLFIAREARCAVEDRRTKTIDYWKDLRESMANLGLFQSRLLYLAHGIINGECTEQDWLNIYESGTGARKLNCKLAENPEKCKHAFSYAFMNASKILNTRGTYVGEDFQHFIHDKVNRSFFTCEIELLVPDIIVSGNLGNQNFFSPPNEPLFDEFKGKLQEWPTKKWNDPNCFVWEYTFDSGNKIPWLDAWHFSRIGANFEYFYEPICRIAKALMPVGK